MLIPHHSDFLETFFLSFAFCILHFSICIFNCQAQITSPHWDVILLYQSLQSRQSAAQLVRVYSTPMYCLSVDELLFCTQLAQQWNDWTALWDELAFQQCYTASVSPAGPRSNLPLGLLRLIYNRKRRGDIRRLLIISLNLRWVTNSRCFLY